jgi:hypothetical protein
MHHLRLGHFWEPDKSDFRIVSVRITFCHNIDILILMTWIFFMADFFLDNSNKLYILDHKNITFVQSARTGPPAPTSFTRTDRYT